jgi:hypothetical protein
MILTVEPCRKSLGVKKKPQISPPTRHRTAMPQTQGRITPETVMNFRGFAYSQSDDMGHY